MLCIFIWPAEREQYDLRRFARDFDGFFSVTAVFNLLPGFARRYAATPFLVIPAPLLVERKLPDLTEVFIGFDFRFAAILPYL